MPSPVVIDPALVVGLAPLVIDHAPVVVRISPVRIPLPKIAETIHLIDGVLGPLPAHVLPRLCGV